MGLVIMSDRGPEKKIVTLNILQEKNDKEYEKKKKTDDRESV